MAGFAPVVVPGLACHVAHTASRRGVVSFCNDGGHYHLPLLDCFFRLPRHFVAAP
jgi:hypothetical protein